MRHYLPLWLIFNDEHSAASLRRFLDDHAFERVGAMLFSHGTDGAGLAPIEVWRALLDRARERGLFLGVDEVRYPRDFATFARFHQGLDDIGPPPVLGLAKFEMLLRELAERHGVRVEDAAA